MCTVRTLNGCSFSSSACTLDNSCSFSSRIILRSVQQCKQLSHYTLHRHITLDTTYCVGSYTIGPTGFPFLKGPDDGLPLCLDLLQLLLVVVSQRCHEIFTLLGFPRDISLVVLLERNANRINCKIHECVLTGVANVNVDAI